jgi:hypothetical protein
MHWVSTARLSVAKTKAARLQARLQSLQSRRGLKEEFIDKFTFFNISNAEILITIAT